MTGSITLVQTTEARLLLASVKSFLEVPGVALTIAVAGVLGFVVGAIALVRMESMGKKLPGTVASAVQTVFDRHSERSVTTGRGRDESSEDSKPSSAHMRGEVSQRRDWSQARQLQTEGAGGIAVADVSLPQGVDAAGEVHNPATKASVLLVQKQERGHRASLQIFRFAKFDLVLSDEIRNTTGATFDVVPAQDGLKIVTLDVDDDGQLAIAEYTFDGYQIKRYAGRQADRNDIAGAFRAPQWTAKTSV